MEVMLMFKIWICLLFVLLLSFAINNTWNAGVTAEDWNRHGPWVQSYIEGNPIPLDVYPPAFHLFMVLPVILLGDNIAWFQIVLAALVNFTLLFIVHKYHGQTATLVMAILMLSNMCFLMYYDSLTPQTLDMVIFPIFMVLIMEKRYWLATAGLVFLGYLHLYGIVFLLIATIYSFFYKREYLKYLMVAYILFIPLVIFQYIPFIEGTQQIYAPDKNLYEAGLRDVWYQAWATEETLYFEKPWNLLMFTGFTIPMALYTIYRFYKDRKQFKLDEYQKFCIIWAICFIPAMYMGIWRGTSYMIVPLMFLIASLFREEKL
jgi:hypothetical protein